MHTMNSLLAANRLKWYRYEFSEVIKKKKQLTNRLKETVYASIVCVT